jgi:CheY-like chemotaxis protein
MTHYQEQPTDVLEEMKDTLIRSVQHELRTPVSIIMGYADLLGSGALGTLAEEQQQAIDTIVGQADILRNLVERVTMLLDLTAHETAQQPLTVNDTVNTVIVGYHNEAQRAGLTLTSDLAVDLPLISGNPGYLKQAIDCLVENGLKFTPRGGRVEIKAEVKGMWVYLRVRDSGIGIAPEKIDHIFDKFYQIDGSITRQYDGLGLGLAVTKAVAEAHGGSIEVESQPGQGSCFTMKIPALTAPIQPMAIQPKPRRRILIVDDEAFVAMTLQEGLEKLPDCDIATATSGQEALQFFQEQPYDLLITDYRMPDIDGLTLAGQIQQLHPQTATIVITAYGDSVLRHHAQEIAVEHVLDKPFQLAEVRQVTSQVLAGMPT